MSRNSTLPFSFPDAEPLIRVMVEGPEEEQISDIARRIVTAIREALS